jgi:AcrR family transcriptional regulator
MSPRNERASRKATRQQRRTSRTRNRLLEAARAVFSERGFEAVRIDEITERADLGKGTFYYHFGSKEKIIREVMSSVLAELIQAVEERCAGVKSLSELLDALIAAHIEFFCTRWEDFVLYFQGRTDLTLEDSYPGMETPFHAYLGCIERLLGTVIAESVPPHVLRRIACAVAGFLSGYYAFAAISSGQEDVDSVFRSLRGAIVVSLEGFIESALHPAAGNGPRGAEG